MIAVSAIVVIPAGVGVPVPVAVAASSAHSRGFLVSARLCEIGTRGECWWPAARGVGPWWAKCGAGVNCWRALRATRGGETQRAFLAAYIGPPESTMVVGVEGQRTVNRAGCGSSKCSAPHELLAAFPGSSTVSTKCYLPALIFAGNISSVVMVFYLGIWCTVNTFLHNYAKVSVERLAKTLRHLTSRWAGSRAQATSPSTHPH